MAIGHFTHFGFPSVKGFWILGQGRPKCQILYSNWIQGQIDTMRATSKKSDTRVYRITHQLWMNKNKTTLKTYVIDFLDANGVNIPFPAGMTVETIGGKSDTFSLHSDSPVRV